MRNIFVVISHQTGRIDFAVGNEQFISADVVSSYIERKFIIHSQISFLAAVEMLQSFDIEDIYCHFSSLLLFMTSACISDYKSLATFSLSVAALLSW